MIDPNFPDKRELIAWVLTNSYGALSTLFVQPKHRQLGLAKALIQNILRINKGSTGLHTKEGVTVPAYCYIVDQNDTSTKLFESLGFARKSNVAWINVRVCEDR